MPVVRYTHPLALEAHEPPADVPPELLGIARLFGLPVQAAQISLSAETIHSFYAGYTDSLALHYQAERWGLYLPEFLRASRVRAILEQACTDQADVEPADNLHLWWFCSFIVFGKRFLHIGCPACGKDYGPANCQFHDWVTADEQLGGTRVTCAAGHNLYVCARWQRYDPRDIAVYWAPWPYHCLRPADPDRDPYSQWHQP